MRGLKERFTEELQTGKLAWLLEEIKRNAAISASFGDNILEVYYRGALACTLKQGGGYTFTLDEKHFTTPEMKEEYNIFIRDKKALPVYQRKLPVLMTAMDEAAESVGIKVEFPQEVVDASTCVIDPNFPVGKGAKAMLVSLEGQLYVLKDFHADNAAVTNTIGFFKMTDQAEMLEDAKSVLANMVALGLCQDIPLSADIKLAFLCASNTKSMTEGEKTFLLPEGSYDLATAIAL